MEVDARSGAAPQTGSAILRKKPCLRIHEGKLTGLINLGKRLKTIKRETFKKKNGNLLSLMEIEVQLPAITALARYYDSPLRCFTFQDFQLAPTIEEFEHILGLPQEGTTPYQYLEHHASISTIAAIMRLRPKELEDKLVMRNQVRGLTQGYLEQYLYHLADREEWETFMDVLALTVYDIVLFPRMEDLVDYTAIDVFVARKTRSENPVTAILADVYGTMSFIHERKGKKILCCLPTLYAWMTACMFKGVVDVGCSSKDPSHQGLKEKGGNEWAHFFAGLYGGKFGHPMKGAPSPDSLTAFFIYYEDGHCTEMLRKVRSAWKNVVRAERDLRVGVVDSRAGYHAWILERVEKVKLPLKRIND
ncbi:uncharacterized protein LOC106753481 [Vigna radiata var. radiata]|uniref:Uncharacterized protein LOC106753481 n=1 Tax=Vigna radiata var. radiata TaxID=3916 RepID=A0A1S3TAJ3_VIGRR|nr:uncharacterized protein LOC106753481 [Vigna radiata var. radiata]